MSYLSVPVNGEYEDGGVPPSRYQPDYHAPTAKQTRYSKKKYTAPDIRTKYGSRNKKVVDPDTDDYTTRVKHLAELPSMATSDSLNTEKDYSGRLLSGSSFWKPIGEWTAYMWFGYMFLAFSGAIVVGIVAGVPSANLSHTWWNFDWRVNGYVEWSHRYEIVTIVLPIGLSAAFLIYALNILPPYMYFQYLFNYYRDGVDYLRVFDSSIAGIAFTWLVGSMCGLTNLSELLLLCTVYVTGHALLAVSEYYAYNERHSLGGSGSGKATWTLAFLSHSIILILLPLDFANGSRHHSTGAACVLAFYMANLVLDHLMSFVVVFATNGEGIKEDVAIACHYNTEVRGLLGDLLKTDWCRKNNFKIIRGGGTLCFQTYNAQSQSDLDYIGQWTEHMHKLLNYNNVRVLGNLVFRMGIVLAVCTGFVFMKKSQVITG